MLTYQQYEEYHECGRCDLEHVVECYDCGVSLINGLWADANPNCPYCGHSLYLLDQACYEIGCLFRVGKVTIDLCGECYLRRSANR